MSQGDCPKHGRWYGVCHCCYEEAQREADLKTRQRIYLHRNALLEENESLRARVKLLEGVVNAARHFVKKDRSFYGANALADAVAILDEHEIDRAIEKRNEEGWKCPEP